MCGVDKTPKKSNINLKRFFLNKEIRLRFKKLRRAKSTGAKAMADKVHRR
jgi:hypothetical protein